MPHASQRRFRPAALTFFVASAALIALPACTSRGPQPQAMKQATDQPVRFSEQIDAFIAADAASPSQPGVVLFVGSSSIRMWNLEQSFPDLPTLNRGFGGSTFSDAIQSVDALINPHAPSAIILYEGDNDIASGLTPQQVFEDFKTFIHAIRERKPRVPILFLSIKPSVSRQAMWPAMQEANAMIRQACKTMDGVEYVDISAPLLDASGNPKPALFRDDMLHLNEQGYEPWNTIVRNAIKQHADQHKLQQAIATLPHG